MMTIGIYVIRNKINDKVYVGKSINCELRFKNHKYNMRKKTINKRSTNRHLYNAFQKYGHENFETFIVQSFDIVDETVIAERELYWMDRFNSCNRNDGYNLRRDSSTGMITHPETRKLQSKAMKGVGNPNFDNGWHKNQKERMSKIKKQQHMSGDIYNNEWRIKIGVSSKKAWQNNPESKERMAKNVSKTKQKKHNFLQMNEENEILRTWYSIEEIIKENPQWKWQNIYSVCNGYKKRIYGFKWRKVLSDEN